MNNEEKIYEEIDKKYHSAISRIYWAIGDYFYDTAYPRLNQILKEKKSKIPLKKRLEMFLVGIECDLQNRLRNIEAEAFGWDNDEK